MLILNKEKLDTLKLEFGEAFYVLNTKQFEDNYDELKNEFSNIYPNFNIAYSYKTNYIPKLCQIIDNKGGYAEVVSEMELQLALKIGVKPCKIIWNGPIKKHKDLINFLLNGGIVNVDSLEEMNFIKKNAELFKDNIFNIGIRCNFDVGDGVLSRFGFDVYGDEFKIALNYILESNNMKFKSLHCHFAKRQIDFWPARVSGMLALIEKIGVIPEIVDLGGGLFGKMDEKLKKQFAFKIPSYADYAKIVSTLFAEKFSENVNQPQLLIEPGSALVGDCMDFVGTVKTIKKIKNKYIASILGSQKNISMTGVNPPISVVHMNNSSKKYDNLDMVGFTCIESDVLYSNYNGKLAIDDMVIFGNCGSYSLVMKPPFILPNFPVIELSSYKTTVIKRGETFDDIFQTFVF